MHQEFAWQIVAIFGVGLIGRKILEALMFQTSWQLHSLPFSWNNPIDRARDSNAIVNIIRERIAEYEIWNHSGQPGSITVIWSAGVGGFSSKWNNLDAELDSFLDVLSFAKNIFKLFYRCLNSFQLISSAGGLFEGQRDVSHKSAPNPIRPYGYLKLAQERELQSWQTKAIKTIFRPSSVYGFAGYKARMGLIPTLLWNATQHRVNYVYGRFDTLRDYVLADDVGNYVANKICLLNYSEGTFTLASGRPSTIGEIIQKVENITLRRLYVQYSLDDNNTGHNSYSQSLLPYNWHPTNLEIGMRWLHQAMIDPQHFCSRQSP